jgi:ankyrin repeat protein
MTTGWQRPIPVAVAAFVLIGASAVVAAERSPLIDAAKNTDRQALRALVQKKADVNAAEADGTTALHWASYRDDLESADLLIRGGAKVNAVNDLGATPLWTASLNASAAMAQGADVHARSEVWSQVMAVPPHGMPQYNRMIAHGGDTPLMFAARVGDLGSAKLLVAAGANVNDADAWGVSATVLAAHSGFGDLVELLLERGADPNAATPGFTALHAAIMRRHEPMVTALLSARPFVDTPLPKVQHPGMKARPRRIYASAIAGVDGCYWSGDPPPQTRTGPRYGRGAQDAMGRAGPTGHLDRSVPDATAAPRSVRQQGVLNRGGTGRTGRATYSDAWSGPSRAGRERAGRCRCVQRGVRVGEADWPAHIARCGSAGWANPRHDARRAETGGHLSSVSACAPAGHSDLQE